MRTGAGIAAAVAAVNRDPTLALRVIEELDLGAIAKADTAGVVVILRRCLEALEGCGMEAGGDLAFAEVDAEDLRAALHACSAEESRRNAPARCPVPGDVVEARPDVATRRRMRCLEVLGDGRRPVVVTYEADGRRFRDVRLSTWAKWARSGPVIEYGPRVRVERDGGVGRDGGITFAYHDWFWAPCPQRLSVVQIGLGDEEAWRVSLL